MIENTIKVNKTARYFISQVNPATVQTAWIILHGYGHLPQFFMRKFNSLCDEGRVLVFPEGLHRFYIEGASGKVGASWMTKEAREADIQDNIEFLNELSNKLTEVYPMLNKIIVLGFSQGGATAARWVSLVPNQLIKALVLWASLVPDDVIISEQFKSLPVFLVYGNEDEYVKDEIFSEHIEKMGTKLSLHPVPFNGKHEVPEEALGMLVKNLKKHQIG